LRLSIERYWKKFKKPIIITENGISTSDDSQRVKAIGDYMQIIHQALSNKIDIRGYYHWSTWDNFEWSLGRTYRFGLYHVDLETMERTRKPSGEIFSKLAYTGEIEIN
jgi:beta-glucosidase